MQKNNKKIVSYITLVAIFIAVIAFIFIFFPVNKTGETAYLYIDNDDTADSIDVKLKEISYPYTAWTTKAFVGNSYRTGRYEVSTSIGALLLSRHIKNGQQSPVRLTIPSVRTMDKLADELSEKLMLSRDDLMKRFLSEDSCSIYGKTVATMPCLFIPNTYEVYWNITPDNFLRKMQKESAAFWNEERVRKAKALGLSENEVITLASIIDEETANNGEKPMIAGMYYNRYKQEMPLQADPTVKYALGNFELKRIYNNMLSVDSPYNTYRNAGLPPGPIRIPSVAGIDAVLNLVHHNYLYMCAKEDFSGTHNFARSYQEHLQNAAKYTKALNERNIK